MTTAQTWIDDTRETVAARFDCGVCLDFGYLDGLGPCPHCDPDGYAEYVFHASQERRSELGGVDPWSHTETRILGPHVAQGLS